MFAKVLAVQFSNLDSDHIEECVSETFPLRENVRYTCFTYYFTLSTFFDKQWVFFWKCERQFHFFRSASCCGYDTKRPLEKIVQLFGSIKYEYKLRSTPLNFLKAQNSSCLRELLLFSRTIKFQLWVKSQGTIGPGGYSAKFCMGRPPKVQPAQSFPIPASEKCYPFHMPNLDLSIPFQLL